MGTLFDFFPEARHAHDCREREGKKRGRARPRRCSYLGIRLGRVLVLRRVMVHIFGRISIYFGMSKIVKVDSFDSGNIYTFWERRTKTRRANEENKSNRRRLTHPLMIGSRSQPSKRCKTNRRQCGLQMSSMHMGGIGRTTDASSQCGKSMVVVGGEAGEITLG